MRRRLDKSRFKGPGTYFYGKFPEVVEIKVDEHGEFDLEGQQKIPVYAISTLVGSAADAPY